MGTIYCPDCGNEVSKDDKFCSNCGLKIENNTKNSTKVVEEKNDDLDDFFGDNVDANIEYDNDGFIKQAKNKSNKTAIDKKLSKDWMACPRCGSNNTEKQPGFWGAVISSAGMAGLIGLVGIILFPLLFLAMIILLLSPIIGLFSIGGPDYKCKDCGAQWSKK